MLDVLSWLNSALYDGLPYAIITISFVLTFKYIRFPDITCAGTFVLGAAVAAHATVHLTCPPTIALFLSCVAGAAGGLLTAGFFIALRIDRLLAGILSAFALYAVNLLLLRPTLAYGDTPTALTTTAHLDRTIAIGGIAWHPYAIGLLAVVVVGTKLVLDWFLNSEFGLAFRALEDEEAGPVTLRRIGLSPAKFQVVALAGGNALVALAGALVSMKEGAANAHRGFDVLITALIAFILGVNIREWIPNLVERLPRRRYLTFLRSFLLVRRLRFTTLAIVGALLYFGVVAFSHRLDVPPELTKIVLALLVACTVGDYGWIRSRLTFARGRRRIAAARDEGMAQPNTVLRATALDFTYPGSERPVLDDVSLTVATGCLVALKGSNGSGKTTLLRLLSGDLDAPDAGTIIVDSVDATFSPMRRRSCCAYLAQDARSAVVGCLSVAENLALSHVGTRTSVFRRALHPARLRQVRDLISQFDLDTPLESAPGSSLSGGQRQAVNLLALLARTPAPRLVFLDEPFNNLDPANVDRCLRMIRDLREQGASIILVNHAIPVELKVDAQYNLPSQPRKAHEDGQPRDPEVGDDGPL